MRAQYVVPDEWHKAVFDAFWQRLETAMDNAPSGELTIPSKDDVTLILAAVLPMAVEAERERCARLADKELADAVTDQGTAKNDDQQGFEQASGAAHAAARIAAAIRQELGHE